jgi:lysophospholipase L1-like esterase
LIVSPNDPHPSAEGHRIWAEQLMEFIDANNLRTI